MRGTFKPFTGMEKIGVLPSIGLVERQEGEMSRKWYLPCLIMGCLFITAGMGSFGEQRPIEAPGPDTLYSATLIDQTDVSMELEKVSCNGQTYVFGYLGRSQVSIDFG
jgi:hypothetical protein